MGAKKPWSYILVNANFKGNEYLSFQAVGSMQVDDPVIWLLIVC